jgi:hypothetical protein
MNMAEIDPVTAKRLRINPYLMGAEMASRRFLWDLNYKSWISRHRLKRMKDSVRGKAVILCNGPSLLNVDFNLLAGVATYGLNKVNLLFEKTLFRPSCIVAVNRLVLEQNREFYNRTKLPLFLDSDAAGIIRLRANVTFIHSWFGARFARDCSMSVPQGNTVTYVALQLAFHMGYRDVALVGCDHNFAVRGPANMEVKSGSSDASHFDPNYFSGGMKWQLPDLPASEYHYALAGRFYSAFGGRVVNATTGGRLEVFPRMELGEWLAQPLPGQQAVETTGK